MSIADLILIVFFILAAVSGYREGFLLELFGLIAILLGVLGSFKLLGWAMVFLSGQFDLDKDILPYVAFALVFIAIVIVVKLLANMLKLYIDKSFLGRVDQVAGAVLGVIKSAFMLSVVIWLADSFHVALPEKWSRDSWLLPLVSTFAPAVTNWVGEFFPVFKDVF